MIRVPTEVVKQRSQTGKMGSWDVAKSVWSNGGLKGFYRGFGSTVSREVRSLNSLAHHVLSTFSPLRFRSHVFNFQCTSASSSSLPLDERIQVSSKIYQQ